MNKIFLYFMDINFLKNIKLEYLYILLIIFVVLLKSPKLSSIIYLVTILSTYSYNKLITYSLLSVYLLIIFVYKNKKPTLKENFNSEEEEDPNILNLDSIDIEEEESIDLELGIRYDIKKLMVDILNISESQVQTIITDNNIETIDNLLLLEDEFSIIQKQRINGYLNLSKIYLFYDEIIIRLLNSNIYEISDITSAIDLLNGKEKFALEYYLLEKRPSNEYIEVLKEIDLYKYYDTIDTSSNEQTIKDMMEIMILFDYYDLLGKRLGIRLNLNVKLGVNGWLFKSLKKLIQNRWQDIVLLKYNVLDRSNEVINKIKLNYRHLIDLDGENQFDFSQVEEDTANLEYNNVVKKYQDVLKKKEYKTLEFLNDYSNNAENNEKLDIKLFENFGNEFSKNMMETINDLVNLRGEQFENFYSTTNISDKYLNIFKKLINIIFKEGRMFYIGFLFLMLSLIIYFAEITM